MRRAGRCRGGRARGALGFANGVSTVPVGAVHRLAVAVPDTRLYVGESTVALSGPNVRRDGPVGDGANGYIFMAGKSEEALAAFDKPGLVWDGDSRDSGTS